MKWEDIIAKLPRPQTPAVFRAMFPDLADWLESPWTGPPPFLVAHAFRVEEAAQDDRYVIRAELPGLDPDKDIEVTIDGRTLTIRAERRQEDSGPYRSEFRYGSLTRSVRLPASVDANDVTARYDKGVLEVSLPVREATPVGTQVPIETVTAGQEPLGRQEPAGPAPATSDEGRHDPRRRPAGRQHAAWPGWMNDRHPQDASCRVSPGTGTAAALPARPRSR